MDDLLTRLRAANARMEDRDDALGEELTAQRESPSFVEESATGEPEVWIAGERIDRQGFVQETIVRRTGRPVLAIVHDQAQMVFRDGESRVWKKRLEAANAFLVRAAQAVGRIELEGHGLDWIGTGWLLTPEVIVTNRHVAAEFARRDGAGFVFRQGPAGAPDGGVH
jgi:endonuclease G